MTQNVDQHHTAAVFPLGKDALVDAAQPVATVAVAITCAALVHFQQQLDAHNHLDPHLAVAIDDLQLLFSYIPVGLLFLLLAVTVKRHPGLVGITSGFMLAHLLFPIIIGGLLTLVKTGASPGLLLFWVFLTLCKCAFILLGWSIFCSHPKCLGTAIQTAIHRLPFFRP